MSPKKSIYSLVLALCVLMISNIACAQDWGEIREAVLNLNVRSKRTAKSEHIVTLAKGQRVKVDFINENWGAVFNLNETVRDEKRAIGYANVKYLNLVKGVPTNSPVATVKPVIEEEVKPALAEASGAMKATVSAAPPDAVQVGVDPNRTPIKITSDRMIYDEEGKLVSFVGNVVAEHGGLTLWADKLSAYLGSKDNKKFSADSIDRIVAEGNVRAKQGKTEGACGKLTYFVENQVLKMERDPKLQDGPNSLTGDVIKFFVRENRSEVVGGEGKRVKAIFMTPTNLKVK